MRGKLVFAVLLLAPTVAWACCAASHPGEHVAIADQEILVTWNAKTQEEHFVRRARFLGSSSKDFGFLVPTPTKPELAEAPDALFDRLDDLLRPEHVKHYSPGFEPLLLRLLLLPRGRAARPGRSTEGHR